MSQARDLVLQSSFLWIYIAENQLANSSGNILENKELLDSLNLTKTKSATIEKSLNESAILQLNLENEGSAYIPFAEFGSRLYFSLKCLSNHKWFTPTYIVYSYGIRYAQHFMEAYTFH